MKNLRFNWCVWLFFGGLSIGIANAASIGEKADVQIVQQNVLCTGLVKDVKGEVEIPMHPERIVDICCSCKYYKW